MNMELTTSRPTLNRYSLTIPSCPHALDVVRFEGLEQLSVSTIILSDLLVVLSLS